MNTARNEIVEAMQNILDNISPDNIKLQQYRMNRLFDLYANYNELIPMAENNKGTEKRNLSLIKTESKIEPSLDKDNNLITGYLIRELVGGSVIVNGQRVRLPERTCREMNLIHGDLIRVNFKDASRLRATKLEDSKTEDEGYRKLLQFCVISDDYMDDELIVKSQIKNGKLTNIPVLEEQDFVFCITDFEREKFSLQAGDLVDMAYHKDYPKTYKIVWKHNSHQQERLQKIF